MHTMDWKVLTILNIVLCVTARPPRAATSQQKFIKYISDNEEKINVGSEKSENREEYVGSYPSYEFSYKVSDPHTHDFKGQEEKRHGDKVNGVYWLIEPDGRKRLVKYHANDEIGFDVLINYSQKGENVENEESNESDSNNNKEHEKKRIWHVIQDFKMKKNSKENAPDEENNAGQSNEIAESGSMEMHRKQSNRKSNEQQNEGSQSNQEGSAQEQSQENTNGQETTTGGNSAMNAVIEEVMEDNVEENNENGNESETGATEDQSSNEDGEAENEENNETNVEQNSKQKQSGENNKKKERAYGYKTYIYHIRH